MEGGRVSKDSRPGLTNPAPRPNRNREILKRHLKSLGIPEDASPALMWACFGAINEALKERLDELRTQRAADGRLQDQGEA